MTTKELFIEKVTLDSKGQFLSSDLIPATTKDIAKFKSKPCNHSLNVDKLIYDEPQWIYDMRYCGVCGEFLGSI